MKKMMRIFLGTSECPYLSEKIYKNPIVKKYLADLARARASAAIGDSGQMIGTRRIYDEWTVESDPAHQKYIGLILRLSCGAAIPPKQRK